MGIQESFDGPNGAKSWVKELQRRGDPDVVICLAGNKCDLEDKRAVTAEEAREYAKSGGLMYTETSARSGFNVKEMFKMIAEELPKTSAGKQDESDVRLRREPKKESGGCC